MASPLPPALPTGGRRFRVPCTLHCAKEVNLTALKRDNPFVVLQPLSIACLPGIMNCGFIEVPIDTGGHPFDERSTADSQEV